MQPIEAVRGTGRFHRDLKLRNLKPDFECRASQSPIRVNYGRFGTFDERQPLVQTTPFLTTTCLLALEQFGPLRRRRVELVSRLETRHR